jgi:5-methylcytosine-specific restriction endonuclease McrA
MCRKLSKIRQQKFALQNGNCRYCGQPMWSRCADTFMRDHGVSHRKARWFQCTAEHLRPVSDGGVTSDHNIAAACRFCNLTRHRAKVAATPQAYERKVRRRLREGRWMNLAPTAPGSTRAD